MMRTVPPANRRLAVHRRATVTVVVLVVLMLLAGMLAQLARRAMTERRQTRRELHQVQAVELVAAGVSMVQSSANPEAKTVEIAAGTIHQTNTGQIQVNVQDDVIVVTALYPSNHDHPVKVTRKVRRNQ